MTAWFPSQRQLVDKQLHGSEEEFDEVPFLPNVIVQRYEGGKYLKQFHGEGVAYLDGGHVYKGTFSNGFMQGHGVYTWADGVKYEGEFARNIPMGHGTYTWLDSSCYVGEVCMGLRHGVGAFRCANASVKYSGQWHHSERQGKGIIYYNLEETSWYEGDWVNNKREGWGVRRYPSGNLYEGQWRNNVRHGEGKMSWLQLGQQYTGAWENGVQHGQGTHTWFLKRVPGSQYPRRNEYSGNFVQGLRHGKGSFCYASGALYKGDWKSNKKHGQGKFIFKNGQIFEGEFVNDHMAEFPAFRLNGSNTPDLSRIRTHSARSDDVESPRRASEEDPVSRPALLGPDIALDISSLLENLPENQREQTFKQVEFAVLRHIGELRTIYSYYSSLGRDQSADNTFLLSRLQLWRLLVDCRVHNRGVTLARIDRCVRAQNAPSEIHSPFSTMLLRKFLSVIVVLAYNIYREDIDPSENMLVSCFSKLMRENIIPNAMDVKGRLFPNSLLAMNAGKYIEKSWDIYKAFCRVNPTPLGDRTMTVRDLIWMFQDLGLFDSEMNTGKLLEIVSVENPAVYNHSHYNVDLEMTFLEFFEALLGCAEIWDLGNMQTSNGQVENCALTDTGVSPKEVTRDTIQMSSQNTSPLIGTALKSSNLNMSPDIGSIHSVERSTPELEPRENPEVVGHLKSLSGGGGPATCSSDDGMREDTGGATTVSLSAAETEVSNHHIDDSPPSPELNFSIQGTHHFFTQRFFPAYEYSLVLKGEVVNDRLRQKELARIALAKAKEDVRLREQWEAEEEERRKEEERRRKEEDEEAEQGEGQEDEPNSSPVARAPATPTPVVITKHQAATAAKKKR